MQYLIDNKEWIFSGIGATILALVVNYLITKRNENTKKINSIKVNDITQDKSHLNNIQLINNQVNYDKNEINSLSQETVKALRELYRLVDLTLKSVEIGLAPVKFNPPKSNVDYLNDSITIFYQFSEYFDSNEILFDSITIILTKKIKDSVLACLKQQRIVEDFKSMNMPSDKFVPEVDKIHEMYDLHVIKDLPRLKEELKNNIQQQIKKQLTITCGIANKGFSGMQS